MRCLRLVAALVCSLLGIATLAFAGGYEHSKSADTGFAYVKETRTFVWTSDTQPQTQIVYLHGVCGRAENGCPFFRHRNSLLLCPRANGVCEGGGDSWSGGVGERRAVIERSLTRAPRLHNERRLLVGFSQGGYLAANLVNEGIREFDSLFVIAADVALDRERLERAGVRRVALGAGRFDGTYKPLRALSEKLGRAGVDVRFVDLGHVGHTYVPESMLTLEETLGWLTGSPREAT